MSDTIIHPNHALITQTCLTNAGRFCLRPGEDHRYTPRIVGFFDLLTVIESAVWYDALRYIRGFNPNARADPVFRLLADHGLIEEVDPNEIDNLTKKDVAEWVVEATKHDDKRVRLLTEEQAYQVATSTLGLPSGDEPDESSRLAFRLSGLDSPDDQPCRLEPGWTDLALVSHEPSIENLALTIARQIGETATGCLEEGASLIRTVFYWTLAQNRQLGLCVEGARSPMILGMFRSVYNSLPRDVYLHISKAFRGSFG